MWRERHRYYLSDPDLRAARAAHPWFVIWDNHDVDENPGDENPRAVEVFREYVPMRQPLPEDPRIGFRALRYGDLLDVVVIDALLNRTTDDLLGEAQWSWLEARLRSEVTSTWRILGNQKLVSPLEVPGGLLSAGHWEDYPESRRRLLQLLGETGDNVMLSGDLHFTIAADMAMVEEGVSYNPETGAGAVGAELLATSITRGNFDEQICSGLCDPQNLMIIEVIESQLLQGNPHISKLELIEHGYGVLEVTPERVVAEMWFSPIRASDHEETLGMRLVVELGANRWSRD